jgi:hypothetical protein
VPISCHEIFLPELGGYVHVAFVAAKTDAVVFWQSARERHDKIAIREIMIILWSRGQGRDQRPTEMTNAGMVHGDVINTTGTSER